MNEAKWLQTALVEWYKLNARKFPWRDTSARDPYKVLVTEILLQKTRAEAVAEIWGEFFKAFPTVEDLAAASEDQVLRVIEKLGLAYRAKRLIKMAQQIVQSFYGKVPSRFDDLLRLNGVGPYVASAVMCFAYGTPQPIVDVNVMRLINRLKGYTDEKSVREFISGIIPAENFSEFNWAILDIAAQICKPGIPDCPACLLNPMCPKIDVDMSRWRILRKHVNGKTIRLSLQPYSIKGKIRKRETAK